MKKKNIIITVAIIIIVIIATIAVMLNLKKSKGTQNGQLETASQMKSMFDSVYSKLKDELPSLNTQKISTNDATQITAYTGIQSTDCVETLVVSEPLMSSQAYSAVTVKVKDGTDIEKIKNEMLENIDMAKWICVSAGKLYITNNGNTIFMVMADEEWSKPVYDEFKSYVNNNIGKELEKDGEDGTTLPEEIIVQ